ncbi:MAG: hypothetical protein GXY36_05700 [Chloroflexi bacterium]|nr:hypothetical protein [Chloroflexota bacterium]
MDNTGWMPLLNSEASPPGMMTVQDWQAAQGILLDLGFLSQPIDLSQLDTLDFLNEIYQQPGLYRVLALKGRHE